MMRIHTKYLTIIAVFLLSASQWSIASAQSHLDNDKPPQAEQLLRSLCHYYSQLKSFSVEVAKQEIFEYGGVKSVRSETLACSLQRPNRLSIVLKQGQTASSIIFDGQTNTCYIPALHQYRQNPVSGSFDQIFERQLEIAAQMLYSIPLLHALITQQPEQLLEFELNQTDYLGSGQIEGKPCHKLRVNTYPFKVQLWILQGSKPLLMRIVSDLESSQQDPLSRGDRIELRWEFKKWTMNRELPKNTFAFSAPVGAKRVETFSMPQEKSNHPMIGQKASDFSLDLLGGGKMNLASHLGKQVVVLDFWATWCGPCVMAMPILTKVTEKFKNKGVIFYAIGQPSRRETTEKIKSFLKQKKLNINVPLDMTGSVSRLYGVSGIPYTVIIDKKGIIRHVQVGVPQNLEAQLTAELTELTTDSHAQPSQVDLMCQSILFLPQKIQVGQPIALKFVAGNLGSQSVQAGTHNIRLSIEDHLAYAGPADLAIGAQGNATFLVPKNIWHVEFTKAGQYNYKLEIDSDGHIKEINEENNTCLGRIEVTAIN